MVLREPIPSYFNDILFDLRTHVIQGTSTDQHFQVACSTYQYRPLEIEPAMNLSTDFVCNPKVLLFTVIINFILIFCEASNSMFHLSLILVFVDAMHRLNVSHHAHLELPSISDDKLACRIFF